MNVGHQGGYTSVISAAHAGKDAFCVNPLVKLCFADELVNFDFADPRGAFGKAALREWTAALVREHSLSRQSKPLSRLYAYFSLFFCGILG